MKQRTRRSGGAPEAEGAEQSGKASGFHRGQEQLGNAAMMERFAQAEPMEDFHFWDQLYDWDLSREQVEEITGHDHDVDEEEVEEVEEDPPTPEGIARADQVREGMWGALLGAEGGPHTVRSGPEADAPEAAELDDGTPVNVISVEEGALEIQWIDGDDSEEGWVRAALFSPQPRLNDGDNHTFQRVEGDPADHSTVGRGDDLSGEDIAQGGLANCFFIAAMNAVGNADPEFLRDAITYNEETGMYRVRFFERGDWNFENGEWDYDEHYEEVDGYIPTNDTGDRAYARPQVESEWGAIYEKAYAQWIGGYDEMGSGGSSARAMTALTGAQSSSADIDNMDGDEVVAFFEQVQEDGTAVTCGSLSSMEKEAQTPLRLEGPVPEAPDADEEEGPDEPIQIPGPYEGTLEVGNGRQRVKPGTIRIRDTGGHVSQARDNGSRGDDEASITGSDVEEGEIIYDSRRLRVEYEEGKGPVAADDLEVTFNVRGLISEDNRVFAWHAYVFREVQDGRIQLYNPWGTWQPEPMTGEDFLEYFSHVQLNEVPSGPEPDDS